MVGSFGREGEGLPVGGLINVALAKHHAVQAPALNGLNLVRIGAIRDALPEARSDAVCRLVGEEPRTVPWRRLYRLPSGALAFGAVRFVSGAEGGGDGCGHLLA